MKPLSTRNRRRLTNLIVWPVCIAGIWWAGYISRGVPEPYVDDFPVTPGIVQSYSEAGKPEACDSTEIRLDSIAAEGGHIRP